MDEETLIETPTPKAEIFISRSNQTHGPYPRNVIENWINTGKINRYDLACTDKTPWQPVAKLLWPDQFAKATSGLTGKQWGLIIAVMGGFIVVAGIVRSLDNPKESSLTSNSAYQTQSATNNRLAPMPADKKADVLALMNLTDDLDKVVKNRGKTKNAWALYTAYYTQAHDKFAAIYPSLPKNDARMMLYNMMDAYENVGALMVGKPEVKTNESPDNMLLVADMRKALLKRILDNNLTPDMIKILESLRGQDE